MKQLSILVPAGESNNLSSIVGSYKIFSRAEAYWRDKGKTPVFNIQLVGHTYEQQYYEGLFSVRPHLIYKNVKHSDLIIIPSLNHNYDLALKKNAEVIAWLAGQYKLGVQLASICTGAFLLAATGALNGKSCSTHWAAAADFKAQFPQVKVLSDMLISDENGIYTNGGAYSFLNLLVYLIEKFYDRETAIFCAKVFQIEMDRNSQSVFSIFNPQKQHSDSMVQKAQAIIESALQDKISIQQLSENFGVGRRNFDRRFIKATGNTPVEYSQRVKVEAAKRAFEQSRKTISEVMYEVGYSDEKAFREMFKKIAGMAPLAYKARYSKSI